MKRVEMNLPRRSFSVDEIAARNNLGPTKVAAEIKAGRLVARKVGKRTIITDADEQAWLDNLPRVEATAA